MSKYGKPYFKSELIPNPMWCNSSSGGGGGGSVVTILNVLTAQLQSILVDCWICMPKSISKSACEKEIEYSWFLQD